jgi:hypothetical protein
MEHKSMRSDEEGFSNGNLEGIPRARKWAEFE